MASQHTQPPPSRGLVETLRRQIATRGAPCLALATLLAAWDAIWIVVVIGLRLPFEPHVAGGLGIDAIILTAIVLHASSLTQKEWRRRLRSSGFFIDLAACMPIELLGLASSEGKPLAWLRLTRLARLYRVDRVLTNRLRDDMRGNWSKAATIRLLVLIAIMTHWTGLVWAFIGTEPDGWASLTDYADNKPKLYLRSLYWACITMTTVGYGDMARARTLHSPSNAHRLHLRCHATHPTRGPRADGLCAAPEGRSCRNVGTRSS